MPRRPAAVPSNLVVASPMPLVRSATKVFPVRRACWALPLDAVVPGSIHVDGTASVLSIYSYYS